MEKQTIFWCKICFCNLCCFVAKSVLLRFTRFCVEKSWTKNCACGEKKVKYQVCKFFPSLLWKLLLISCPPALTKCTGRPRAKLDKVFIPSAKTNPLHTQVFHLSWVLKHPNQRDSRTMKCKRVKTSLQSLEYVLVWKIHVPVPPFLVPNLKVLVTDWLTQG